MYYVPNFQIWEVLIDNYPFQGPGFSEVCSGFGQNGLEPHNTACFNID
jgi:hypothetical protein